ncbi:hypothetical protein [Mycolicibacterium sp. F2034L]|uniref:hypothetical protein n=1 Tax=Mycolicibacterium sp. F2034L TaxID=2926422 RepID=UPI001FF26497|nr:hypothetical protein [Mycolicibacterium sp. F2034L]MCK0172926.1 hypothetical protein [Mycolicibacterium sp. F2034L]
MDNTLAYIDQASFLGLRALGRGPSIQFTWFYDRPVDIDALRRFQRNLGHGLLGRLIERSPLPFGRHRWVASRGPADLDVAAEDRTREEVWAWLDERARRPVDPESGPAWHLGVQPLRDGGAAVTLVVSHTTGDALAICTAIIAAVNGLRNDLGYPPPASRSRRSARAEDARRVVRAVPDIVRAVGATVRVARSSRDDLSASMASPRPAVTGAEDRAVVVPSVLCVADVERWDERAAALGGTSNTLYGAFAARIGLLMGRHDADDRVTLSFPVSERVPGDTRGNALTEARVRADPQRVTTDLTGLRADLKRELVALREQPNPLLAPLPLTPLTPRFLVRRLEGMVTERGAPIGCSNIGDLDAAVSRPDGAAASAVTYRIVEPGITSTILDRSGGLLFLGGCRVGGRLTASVSAWQPGGPNTKDWLHSVVVRALADMGIVAMVEL